MMRLFLSHLLSMLILASAPAFAKTLNEAPTTLDPAKAYVVVEIGKLDDGLMYGTLVLARYDLSTNDIAQPTPPPGGKIPKGGWKLDHRVHLIKPAVKAGDRRLYIAELNPGLWVIEGANDTAFSLGSSTLELAMGTVTDLGVVSVYSDFPEGEKRDVLTAGRVLKGALMGPLFGSVLPPPMPKAIDMRPRGTSDISLPPVFAGVSHPPEWAGEVRFGNHLGGQINRMGGRKARPGATTAARVSPADAEVETPNLTVKAGTEVVPAESRTASGPF